MKSLVFLTSLVVSLSLSFVTVKKVTQKSSSHNLYEVKTDSLSGNERWMNAINNKDLSALEALYIENVYGLSPNGIDFSSRTTLLDIVEKNDFVVRDVKTIKRIKAHAKYDYEIGSFRNKGGDLMKHVVIWDTSQDQDIRELEFLAETDNTEVDLKQIDMARDNWIRLCNANNAKNLINTVYTKNTLYYNHRPMIVGRKNLIPVYSYMNSPNYNLKLEPIIVEAVSETIVYEIGQCVGSYPGKYILIWQKTDEGWQILFDSNI